MCSGGSDDQVAIISFPVYEGVNHITIINNTKRGIRKPLSRKVSTVRRAIQTGHQVRTSNVHTDEHRYNTTNNARAKMQKHTVR